MRFFKLAAVGAGVCAAVVTVLCWNADNAADNMKGATTAASGVPAHMASANQETGLWAWGNVGATKMSETLDVLLAQALTPSGKPADGVDARDKLRKRAKEDPAVMKQLIESYGKQSSVQARQLIVSLLSGIDNPEVLAFSKRLASSSDTAQRRDGFTMLQNLSSDVPEVHSIILQALSGDKTPDVLMLALAALKPPAAGDTLSGTTAPAADAPAIVAQLQELTRNADPTIRLQSILQLAQWDKAGTSQEQWSHALADQVPQVREAAVTAVAQSGTQSDIVKAALIGLANNPHENKDVRGNAVQVLAGFNLNRDETVNLSQLRAQLLGG